MKKGDVIDYGFADLTLILLLHYLVKCRSRSVSSSFRILRAGKHKFHGFVISRHCD